MNTIYEAKSYRVKGISFHHKNPWLLTSLHNGEILLYDYVNGIMIDKFLEHEGPVRSVNFHNTQPFFVSGGDDCKIKVWNYNTKKCQFNLTGHTDYIRTVQFHHELPWIITSSDDQTIRIWNWLNRTLLTTVTGHDHYVMSAFFHPSQDLIVSASLDQTIRVWDYSVLRKKFFEARTNSLEVIAFDVTVKFKIEGHDRGVNWATFHPTLNLIASGSDDKTIKIWKFTDSKWSDADTLRGHHNNVSSVAFHPTHDYLISNSEDKSIRIWDLNKKTSIDKIVKENDRFWVLTTHPTLNIFASGSDSGIIVFKLENTRVPAIAFQNQILVYHQKTIRQWRSGETDKKSIVETKNHSKGLKTDIKSIIINPFVNPSQYLNFALPVEDSSYTGNNSNSNSNSNSTINTQNPSSSTSSSNVNVNSSSSTSTSTANGKILYYYMKFDSTSNKYVNYSSSTNPEQVLEGKNSVCFLSNNKLLTLTSSGALMGYDTNNIGNKFTIELPLLSKEKFEAIYQGPLGKIILKFKNGIVGLLDANTKKIISETNEITDLKFVIWNANLTLGALVGKNSIFIINKNLDILNKIKENSRIKSACFDENNVLFYTTHFHIKYALQENLCGIIKSLECPVYLMMVSNATFYLSDSLQNMRTEQFNYTEVRFKISLLNKNYDDVVNILRSGAIIGLKAIENIQNAGFPDLSLKFVNDPKQKFNLALQSGKLEEAIAAAETLNNKFYYDRLAEKAMMMGKLYIAEVCYVKSKNLDKLMLFYVLTGKSDKLKILQDALQAQGENSRRFLNSIYTNNIEEKIKILTETGHLSLALLAARVHQKSDYVDTILENTKSINKELILNEDDVKDIESKIKASVPLKPIFSIRNKSYHSDWVTHTELKKSGQSNLDSILNQKEDDVNESSLTQSDGFSFNAAQGEESSSSTSPNPNLNVNKAEQKKKIESKWNDEEEEDDEEIQRILEEKSKNTKNVIQSLTIGEEDNFYRNFDNSSIPGIQVALGNFKVTLNYLKSQLGITQNYDSIRPVIKNLYMSSYSQINFIPSVAVNELQLRLTRNGVLLPQNGVSIKLLQDMLETGYGLVSENNMPDAQTVFKNIIKMSIFFIAVDKSEESRVKEILGICSEYIYLTRLCMTADDSKSDKVKYAEFCCIMANCKLESSMHKFLIYKKAKVACKNIKNFITALVFIKKLLVFEKELGTEFQTHFEQAKTEYDNFQKIGTNAHNLSFNVNENLPCARNFFCSQSFKRIDISMKTIKCPLCSSTTSSDSKGEICGNCSLCTLGEEVLGLKLLESYE